VTTRRLDESDEARDQLRSLFSGLDSEELRAVHRYVSDLLRSGDASRHAGGPIDDDDDFEANRRGLESLYPGLSERQLRQKFAEARQVGWPPQATDQYADDVPVSGPGLRRAELPSGSGAGGRMTVPAIDPFKYREPDARLQSIVRTPSGGSHRQFSESDVRTFARRNVPGLSRMLTTLSRDELTQVITQHLRQQMTGAIP
jgi:hypothetical protein